MPGRRDFLIASVVAGVVAGLSSCTPPKVKDNRIRHAMGQRVTVGSFTYNILEAKWEASLGEAPHVRMPQRRFLLVRLSVTNGGGSSMGFPTLALLTEGDAKISEVEDTKDVPDTLGLIRLLGPGETVIGWILFDAPQNNYLLEMTDGNVENEQNGLVELPLRLT